MSGFVVPGAFRGGGGGGSQRSYDFISSFEDAKFSVGGEFIH